MDRVSLGIRYKVSPKIKMKKNVHITEMRPPNKIREGQQHQRHRRRPKKGEEDEEAKLREF